MQTSKKILISTGVVISVLLVIGLVTLRAVMKKEMAHNPTISYEEWPADPFESVYISKGWTVKISQDREQRVEIGAQTEGNFKMENRDGVLYFETDSLFKGERIPVRITTPSIKIMQARGNSHLLMEPFQSNSDSLKVFLADSVLFRVKGNKLPGVFIETSGNARLELLKDPME